MQQSRELEIKLTKDDLDEKLQRKHSILKNLKKARNRIDELEHKVRQISFENDNKILSHLKITMQSSLRQFSNTKTQIPNSSSKNHFSFTNFSFESFRYPGRLYLGRR